MNFNIVTNMIDRYGEQVTLRRLTHGIPFDVTVKARVQGYSPDELVGGIAQGDRMVIISNREIAERQWPGPPKQGDQIIIRGKTATLQAAAATVVVGGVTVMHTMQVRGG